jgi:hypothetical protein
VTSPFPTDPTVQLLIDAGFTTGWATKGDTLILWEHDEDPPAPLTRPEKTNETPSPD